MFERKKPEWYQVLALWEWWWASPPQVIQSAWTQLRPALLSAEMPLTAKIGSEPNRVLVLFHPDDWAKVIEPHKHAIVAALAEKIDQVRADRNWRDEVSAHVHVFDPAEGPPGRVVVQVARVPNPADESFDGLYHGAGIAATTVVHRRQPRLAAPVNGTPLATLAWEDRNGEHRCAVHHGEVFGRGGGDIEPDIAVVARGASSPEASLSRLALLFRRGASPGALLLCNLGAHPVTANGRSVGRGEWLESTGPTVLSFDGSAPGTVFEVHMSPSGVDVQAEPGGGSLEIGEAGVHSLSANVTTVRARDREFIVDLSSPGVAIFKVAEGAALMVGEHACSAGRPVTVPLKAGSTPLMLDGVAATLRREHRHV